MISKYSVKRPYTVLVAVVLVIVLGVVSLSKMTTDLLPDMSFQYALVITTDMGASPEQVESDVTAPIESAMATTSNIKNISSISYNSYSIMSRMQTWIRWSLRFSRVSIRFPASGMIPSEHR